MGIKKANEIVLKDDYAVIMISTKSGRKIEALIDLDDVELCRQYSWYGKYSSSVKDYYVYGYKDGETVQLHRLVTNCPKGLVVDHVQHRTRDNRKSQLKVCTQLENMHNVRRKPSESGFVGITKAKWADKWKIQFTRNYEKYMLGCYKCKNIALFFLSYLNNEYKRYKKIDEEKIYFIKLFLTALDEGFDNIDTKNRKKLQCVDGNWLYVRRQLV